MTKCLFIFYYFGVRAVYQQGSEHIATTYTPQATPLKVTIMLKLNGNKSVW